MATLFDELTALIGEVSARALLERHGGTALYIPSAVDDDHPLAILLGLTAARALSAEFAGIELRLPLGAPGEMTKRFQIEGLLKATSLSYPEIAKRVNTTSRWVERVAKKIRDDQQLNLFED
jgi:hypothetical protein